MASDHDLEFKSDKHVGLSELSELDLETQQELADSESVCSILFSGSQCFCVPFYQIVSICCFIYVVAEVYYIVRYFQAILSTQSGIQSQTLSALLCELYTPLLRLDKVITQLAWTNISDATRLEFRGFLGDDLLQVQTSVQLISPVNPELSQRLEWQISAMASSIATGFIDVAQANGFRVNLKSISELTLSMQAYQNTVTSAYFVYLKGQIRNGLFGALASTLYVFIFVALLMLVSRRGVRYYRESLEMHSAQHGKIEQALRTKNDFLAVVSHELRTPLNGVMGPLQLLADHSSPGLSAHQPLLQSALASCESLLEAVNYLMSYQSVSSVTSVVSTLRLSSISLSTLFAELEAMMQPGLQDRKLLYRRHCDVAGHDAYGLNFPDGVTALAAAIWVDHVMLDLGAVSQIMVNLLSNAQTYTPAYGSITLSCTLLKIVPSVESRIVALELAGSTTPSLSSRARFQFAVTDTGNGIPPEQLASIIEGFSVVDTSMTRQADGLGLGLSIAANLAQKMGGRITVESTLKFGSTFIFEVPSTNGFEFQNIYCEVEFDIDSTIAFTVLPTPVIFYYLETAAVGNIIDAGSPSNIVSVTVTTSTEEPLFRNTFAGVGLSAIAPDSVGVTVPADMCAPSRDPTVVVNPTFLRVKDVSDSTPGLKTIISGLHLLPLAQNMLNTPPTHKDSTGSCVSGSPMPTLTDSPAVNGGARLSLGPRNVLLVEDNLVNQRFAMALLAKLGHTVTLAINGQQAVEKWRSTWPFYVPLPVPLPKGAASVENSKATPIIILPPFDICLMDISMPVMDGLTAAAVIRALEVQYQQIVPRSQLPILAVSAHDKANFLEQCQGAGMQDYISKPIHKNDLVKQLSIYAYSK